MKISFLICNFLLNSCQKCVDWSNISCRTYISCKKYGGFLCMDIKYFKSKDNQIGVNKLIFHNVSCTSKKASGKHTHISITWFRVRKIYFQVVIFDVLQHFTEYNLKKYYITFSKSNVQWGNFYSSIYTWFFSDYNILKFSVFSWKIASVKLKGN